MRTIYFGDKRLVLAGDPNKEVEKMENETGTIFYGEVMTEQLKIIIHHLFSPEAGDVVIINQNEEKFLDRLKEELYFLQAAGGFVYTQDHKVLMIFRKGKWDLPKGKLDEGEELESCALREIEEETGVKPERSQGKLCVTYHAYFQFDKRHLKETHWYLVSAKGDQHFLPQTEEDIEKCEWVGIDNLVPFLENTHGSITDVIRAGINRLKKN